MKKLIWISILIILSSCRVGHVEGSGGVDNVAKIEILRGVVEKYKDGVDVFIDDNIPFKAQVNKTGSHKVKGYVYSVQKGNRHIRVVHKGETLYDRNVVMAIGETRKIQLP